MGTPEFAVASLDALLLAGYFVVAVVTIPDKFTGRGKKLSQSAVKKFALKKGLKVLQPVRLKDETFVEELKKLKPQLQVVVAFRMLPEMVWQLPKYGTINLHASLLPQYRGAAPINHVLMNGEKETGLTTFLLDKEIDTGSILLQEKLSIGDNEYLDSLHNRMMIAGAKILVKTVDKIRIGKAKPMPQKLLVNNTVDLKSAPKILRQDCLIHWDQPVNKIYNMIRGLSPYPAPFSFLVSPNGRCILVKIYRVEPEHITHLCKPGSFLTDAKTFIKIAALNGFFYILELQMEGRKRMSIAAFLRGFDLNENWYFSAKK